MPKTARFPKKVFVYLDKRTDGYELCIAESLNEAAYGLSAGDSMKIAEYTMSQEPGEYTARLHYVPKGSKI